MFIDYKPTEKEKKEKNKKLEFTDILKYQTPSKNYDSNNETFKHYF